MSAPIEVDLPHQLGRTGARERIGKGINKLAEWIPGGSIHDPQWDGDRLAFAVIALGQRVEAIVDVADDHVHLRLDLPPMLALAAGRIRDKLERDGPKLLT
ncbi:polyhydroxyalkanoic acid system family protein [Sphingomonas sp. BGYR3]|uniref:polyhydroxyalkanoic acid system family protein n=1 Tax=Sphingomonas sp. BGYR3 TaxID=2975483 RepID=UPI0021A6C109|nr:polyhydroxyalkanoic acid system family protein [Sphingomonas sp. BGYR3]MDG5488105.1 polyhydroxyalkanoic acid system family protein [Sphingomonas sp. BGYR3]